MPSPSFHAPDTIEQAIALLCGDGSARPLAGGTDLIVQMRAGRIAPAAIVDLKRIVRLSGVRREVERFVIGAATPCSSLKDDAGFAAVWPGIVDAANLVGSVQVRNRATVAGNLCNASPAADTVPALLAAGATCLVAGPSGEREVAVQDILVAPGKTSLASGEFVVEIRLPQRRKGEGDAYLRSIPRTEMDIAVVGVGANIALDGNGICTDARIAVGAVAPTVLLVEEAGAALVGTQLDDAALEAMAQAVRAACRPIDDKRGTAAYRTAMAGVLARRTVLIARDRAGASA